MDQNLLCDEEWLIISTEVDGNDITKRNVKREVPGMSKEECFKTIRLFIGKEERFMPEPDYLCLLGSDQFVWSERIQAIKWLLKTHKRMIDVSGETLFGAMNNMDRFISKTRLKRWQGPKDRMFQLLSVACLSVACKFNNGASLPLLDLQVEKLDYAFTPSLIQKMELNLLDTLGWNMDCVTPFSYVELLIQCINFDKTTFDVEDLTVRVTDLLVTVVLDARALVFRPSIIAASTIRCILDDLPATTDYMTSLHQCLSSINPQYHKDGMIKCQKIIIDLFKKFHFNMLSCANPWHGPESPVTVLKVYDCGVAEDSPMKKGSCRKRKREQLEY